MDTNTQQISAEQIKQLIKAVEQTFSRTPKTPKDFDLLRLSIFNHTSTLLSATTLKRLWGYLGENVEPRRHTLNVLCRYAGWTNLNAMQATPATAESGPLAIEAIDTTGSQLNIGDRLSITWLPNRIIEVEHLGASRFRILSALNTRLQPADTFTTAIIANDHPLYLNNLTRGNTNLGVYICGRNSGIRFRITARAGQSALIG